MKTHLNLINIVGVTYLVGATGAGLHDGAELPCKRRGNGPCIIDR